MLHSDIQQFYMHTHIRPFALNNLNIIIIKFKTSENRELNTMREGILIQYYVTIRDKTN